MQCVHRGNEKQQLKTIYIVQAFEIKSKMMYIVRSSSLWWVCKLLTTGEQIPTLRQDCICNTIALERWS